MTDRPPLRCEQIEADLLAGPNERDNPQRIADHLAICPACHALSRQIERDRTQLRNYLDGADWLPVANRVFATLPEREPRRNDHAGTGVWATGRLARTSPHAERLTRGGARRPSPIVMGLQAACLLIVGLGLGLTIQQVWSRADGDRTTDATELAATGDQGGALGAQPGTNGASDHNANSIYIPAPGDNPPLIVPAGSVGITASQNRETWRSVRHTVQDGISPLLYPPVPPGTFDSVVIDAMAANSFAVRYATEDMELLMTAGSAAGDATIRNASGYQATVRGTPATVMVGQTDVPGQGGLRLDGQPSTALAAGTIVEVTWAESGLLKDPVSGMSSSTLPYRVTAAGLPVDVVMTFVDSLVPFGNGWDELRDDLPTGTSIVTPGTMPDGFGTASLVDQSVTGSDNGVAISYVVAYQRVSGNDIDRIVFSAAPAATAVESGDLAVAGHPATRSSTPATAERPMTRTVTWQIGATSYRIDFSGKITDAEIDRVLDGLTETTVAPPATRATGQSLTDPTRRAA